MGLTIAGGSRHVWIKPRTGDYIGPGTGPTSNAAVASGTQTFIPLYVGASTAFDQILAWNAAHAGTTGTLRLGIYSSDSNGLPSGAPVEAGATIDTTTVSTATGAPLTIAQTLNEGLYWLSAQTESTGTVPTFVLPATSNPGHIWPSQFTNVSLLQGNGFSQSHTGALASVTPSGLTMVQQPIIVWLRAA